MLGWPLIYLSFNNVTLSNISQHNISDFMCKYKQRDQAQIRTLVTCIISNIKLMSALQSPMRKLEF